MAAVDVPDEITRWLEEHDVAAPEAIPALFGALYSDLKRRAHFALAAAGPLTVSTTGLVNEAYLRLVEAGSVRINNRRHFLALAAKVMRWVAVDLARSRSRQRRGGGVEHVDIADAPGAFSDSRADEILALDQALRHLAEVDPRLVEVVEHRCFGGLSVEETADLLEVSARTVKRDWRAACSFLSRELGSGML